MFDDRRTQLRIAYEKEKKEQARLRAYKARFLPPAAGGHRSRQMKKSLKFKKSKKLKKSRKLKKTRTVIGRF